MPQEGTYLLAGVRGQGPPFLSYRDFRDFADIGGGREALKPPGFKRATTDREIAEKLAADRVEELQERRLRKVIHGIERTAEIKEFAAHHLWEKAKTGSVSVVDPSSRRHERLAPGTAVGAVACSFERKAR